MNRLAKLLPLLAFGLFTTSCLTTQPVGVPMTLAPEFPINDHAGVAVMPLEYDHNDPEQESVAKQVETRMRQALGADGNGFKLVDVAKTEQIQGIIEKRAENWDNLSPETIEAIQQSFGNEIAPTGFFYGRVNSIDHEDIGFQGEKLDIHKGGLKTVNKRKGGVLLDVEICFLDARTNESRPFAFPARCDAEVTESDSLEVPAPPLDYSNAKRECVKQVMHAFESKWAVTTRDVSVPVFTGDGWITCIWEADEYPHFKLGAQRMANKQFVRAEQEFMKQIPLIEEQGKGAEVLAYAYYNVGLSLEAQNRLPEALEWYIKAVDLSAHPVIAEGKTRCEGRIEKQSVIEDQAAARPAMPEA